MVRFRRQARTLTKRLLYFIGVVIVIELIAKSYHQTHDNVEGRLNNTSNRSIILEQPLYTNEKQLVVLLSYQRSGSTFLSELLNQNEAGFHWFEPLDGLYSALYGKAYGFNVPDDYWFEANGTQRNIPEVDQEAIADTVKNILTCNVDALPYDVLIHSFVEAYRKMHVSLNKYVDCIDVSTFHKAAKSRATLANACQQASLAQPSIPDHTCMDTQLRQKYYTNISHFPELKNNEALMHKKPVQKRLKIILESYRVNSQIFYKVVQKCLPEMKKVCEAAEIRSIKSVRMTMESVEILLRKLPQVKIVHNFRDPRAVVVSRMRAGESFMSQYATHIKKKPRQGHFAGKRTITFNLIKEAELYCSRVVTDLNLVKTMSQNHPESFYQLEYEILALRPDEEANKLYKFLRKQTPREVTSWVSNNTHRGGANKMLTTRDSVSRINLWEKHMTVADSKTIRETVCQELFNKIPYLWG